MFGKLMNLVAQFILRMLLCGDQVPRASGTDHSTSLQLMDEGVNRDESMVRTPNLFIYTFFLCFNENMVHCHYTDSVTNASFMISCRISTRRKIRRKRIMNPSRIWYGIAWLVPFYFLWLWLYALVLLEILPYTKPWMSMFFSLGSGQIVGKSAAGK